MEFQAFPKIPRLNREIIITEKIDGTNAQILVYDKGTFIAEMYSMPGFNEIKADNDKLWEEERAKNGAIVVGDYLIRAGSRNRWLTHEQDNFGFWNWVNANASELLKLGHGRHYGEWWGQGIQRGYGLTEKRFWLFNTHRWAPKQKEGQHPFATVPQLGVVPELYRGPMEGNGHWSTNPEAEYMPRAAVDFLRWNGSVAAPGFMDPEGIVMFHTKSNQVYKATCKDDDKAKGE